MNDKFANGSVKIANETLDLIVKESVESVDGVVSCNKQLLERVKKSPDQYYDSKFNVTINVILNEYEDLNKTIKNIQKNVKKQFEIMTGLIIEKVNVIVEKLVINE